MTTIEVPSNAPVGDLTATMPVHTEAHDDSAAGKPNHRAIYGSSVFAMIVVFLVGVAVPAAMVYGNAAGWALGAFCAFWGGPSFGVMVGSARVSTWYDRHGGH